MGQMNPMIVDVGVYTGVSFDISGLDWTGVASLILTVKNAPLPGAPEIIEREFTAAEYSGAEIVQVIVSPDESLKLREGAVFDFCKKTEAGLLFKVTENGAVILKNGVGDCIG